MRLLLPLFLIFFFHCFSQRQEGVDFTGIDATISLSFELREIRGYASYEFNLLENVDSIFLDAKDINIEDLFLDKNRAYPYFTDASKMRIKAPDRLGKHTLVVRYNSRPKQTVYFIQKDATEQIWTQGQGKNTSHWLPSIDDMNDKIEFDLTIQYDKDYEVISNGKLIEEKVEYGIKTSRFDMDHPMSSYLAAFAIGNFDKKVMQSSSGIPIELYYEPKDSLKVEPTYRHTKEIFDFLEDEIGVPYPWQNYKQVPVQDFLYAGMENTTCTIFSNQYMIDSTAFVDKNYVNVNAHELAHQWFGNLVTEVSGEHHWLHEGFATYYAYLAEKELFGPDHFYWKLYQTAKTLHDFSKNEGGEALTDPNANSLTFYEKGAWALVVLRERMGDMAFKKGIQNYLNTYAFKNATISNFLTEMENTSKLDLTNYRKKWLEGEAFPWGEARSLLERKSNSLRTYFGLRDSLKGNPPLVRLWEDFDSDELKAALIKDFSSSLLEWEFLGKMDSASLKVQKALVLSIDSIPGAFKSHFETYLNNKSYVTQEAALFKLWQAFPESRERYLNLLDGVVGLPNKNVRQLWLTLALISEDYRPKNKKAFYNELNGYTATHHNFEIRQLAFQYLYQIKALSDSALLNLIKACDHHVWQFKKSSRNLVREIDKSDQGKERLLRLTLNKDERKLLDKILNL